MVYRSSSRGDSSEDESSSPTSQRRVNVFRNDGSFLEMFKKMQEKQLKGEQKDETATSDSESKTTSSSSSSTTNVGTSSSSAVAAPARHPIVGKRRGGRVLPTGKVKKSKVENDTEEPPPKDAWSVYLAEVKRYKETTCEEDGKTRPLVK